MSHKIRHSAGLVALPPEIGGLDASDPGCRGYEDDTCTNEFSGEEIDYDQA